MYTWGLIPGIFFSQFKELIFATTLLRGVHVSKTGPSELYPSAVSLFVRTLLPGIYQVLPRPPRTESIHIHFPSQSSKFFSRMNVSCFLLFFCLWQGCFSKLLYFPPSVLSVGLRSFFPSDFHSNSFLLTCLGFAPRFISILLLPPYKLLLLFLLDESHRTIPLRNPRPRSH